MTITYEYEGALYVNLTNKCNCACEFCLRQGKAEGSIYTEDSLWLEREPTREEALDSFLSRDVRAYREIVFCGYGEPTYRLDDLLWLVDQLKEKFGDKLPPVRINTNGHANLIHGRDTCPELKGRIDTLSISLNNDNAAAYVALCHPVQGEAAYQAMLDFARESATYVPNVVLTIVDKDKTPEEIENCKKIADGLGVTLRLFPAQLVEHLHRLLPGGEGAVAQAVPVPGDDALVLRPLPGGGGPVPGLEPGPLGQIALHQLVETFLCHVVLLVSVVHRLSHIPAELVHGDAVFGPPLEHIAVVAGHPLLVALGVADDHSGLRRVPP